MSWFSRLFRLCVETTSPFCRVFVKRWNP